jgi:dephospho-CoA kinase
VEAIKLVEGGLAERCDEVWLVACTAADQRERLTARGVSGEDAERRIATQGPDIVERLTPAATRVISTSGDRTGTRERVEDALADALAPILLGP